MCNVYVEASRQHPRYYENLGNSSWALIGLEFGANLDLSGCPAMGLVRFIYSLGCSVIGGALGTIFNLLALGFYSLKCDINNMKRHARGMATDLNEVLGIAMVIGLVGPIADACTNSKASYNQKVGSYERLGLVVTYG